MSVLRRLLNGLDDETRTRTVTMIAESVAEERALPAEAPRRRAADIGTRQRRSSGPRLRPRGAPPTRTTRTTRMSRTALSS